MNATLFLDAALDALLDSLRMLPFLFVAFLILEALEHYSSNRLTHFFQHKKGGPAIASLLGCIPQCGFSTLISSLYCGGIVTVGTLIAVYLSTSDEAILILLAHPDQAGVVGKLLLAKLIIAIPAGYLVDFIWNRWRHPQKHVEDLCDHCGCHDHHGIIRPALNHTLKLFAFILVFNAVLNLLLEGIGLESLSKALLGGTVFQPFLTALLGLIPNCAASITITKFYLEGVLNVGSMFAGLLSCAGIGLIVLFKTNHSWKKNVMIVTTLYGISVVCGIIVEILFGM